jgi:hypothetical protein
MESTHERSGVTTGIAQLAALLREQLLQARRIYLRNRAPKSPYVHQLRRKVSAEQTRTFEILLAISFADIDDGIAPSIAAKSHNERPATRDGVTGQGSSLRDCATSASNHIRAAQD